MNAREYYRYLAAAREQLWQFVRALPDEDLDRDLIDGGERFHNIKDLLLHVTDVEDHWIHVIARGDGVGRSGERQYDWVRPQAQQYDLNWILSYSQQVTGATGRFLDSEPDLERPVKLVQDDPASATVTLDQLLWHVMTHEIRHTAQIALMIRQLGHTPPWLDYLRFARPAGSLATHAAGEDGLGMDDDAENPA